MSLLTIENLSHTFGGLAAIKDVSLTLDAGETLGIIGPNGAGKTTFFNLLCGIYPIQAGKVCLDQDCLNNYSINQITRAGIARTFQNIRLFKALSVLDNVLIATRAYYGLHSALLRSQKFQQQEAEAVKQAHQLLARLDLTRYAHHKASELPYGLQRRLEIARALATHPKVLLLDEPACGMNPSEAQAMAKLIREIQHERQLAILLIDHQMAFVMSLCERIVVLNFGEIIAMGDAKSVCADPIVIESYLGSVC